MIELIFEVLVVFGIIPVAAPDEAVFCEELIYWAVFCDAPGVGRISFNVRPPLFGLHLFNGTVLIVGDAGIVKWVDVDG